MTRKPLNISLFKLNEKGQFSYVIYFIAFMIMFLPIVLVGFPVLQTLAIGFSGATEEFNNASEGYLKDIDDPELKADINSLIQAQTNAQETNIEILSAGIIFGQIAIIILVYLGLYLLGRRNIEVGSMG